MDTRRRLLLALVAIWCVLQHREVRADESKVCEDICAEHTCGQECWLTQFDYDNSYPSTTCGDQGFPCCGDGVCDSGHESCGSCSADCYDAGAASCESECVYTFNCSSGEVCNPSHQCVLPSPNAYSGDNGNTSCSNKSNCKGPDTCMSDGECVITHKDECDSGYSCTNSIWCQENADPDSYCNPGNDKCMYLSTPGCPLPNFK
jgi:hypothetical protein